MIEHYHDAMTICRFYDHPDLFITFTCNPLWPEIQRMLDYISGQKPDDRPDIISRVFRVKLLQLVDDIKKNEHFGKTTALIYTIEFQKRGLPHVHCLVWLDELTNQRLHKILIPLYLLNYHLLKMNQKFII